MKPLRSANISKCINKSKLRNYRKLSEKARKQTTRTFVWRPRLKRKGMACVTHLCCYTHQWQKGNHVVKFQSFDLYICLCILNCLWIENVMKSYPLVSGVETSRTFLFTHFSQLMTALYPLVLDQKFPRLLCGAVLLTRLFLVAWSDCLHPLSTFVVNSWLFVYFISRSAKLKYWKFLSLDISILFMMKFVHVCQKMLLNWDCWPFVIKPVNPFNNSFPAQIIVINFQN